MMRTGTRKPEPDLTKYSFEDFVADLQLITSAESDQAEIIRRISRKMKLVLPAGAEFLTAPEKETGEKHYARHMVYIDRNRRFVIMSCVWRPGQGTPVHDHGTWGCMGILKGELKVTNYVRLDDGRRAGYAELREASGVASTPGSVTYVLPPNEEIHKVENFSDETTLSLHVYGRDVVECNMYDLARKTYRPYSVEYFDTNPTDGK